MDFSLEIPSLNDLSISRIIAIAVIVTITVTATRLANGLLNIVSVLLSKIHITVKTTKILNKYSFAVLMDVVLLFAYTIMIYYSSLGEEPATRADIVWLLFLSFFFVFMLFSLLIDIAVLKYNANKKKL